MTLSEVRFRAVEGPAVGLSALSGVEPPEASTVPPDRKASPQDNSLIIGASGPSSVGVPGGTSPQSAEYIRESPDGHMARFRGSSCEHRAGG